MDRTYAIYVQPPYDSAVYALIRYYKWQHVYYLYDTEQGLSLSLSPNTIYISQFKFVFRPNLFVHRTQWRLYKMTSD